jgi:hypothetical protein
MSLSQILAVALAQQSQVSSSFVVLVAVLASFPFQVLGHILVFVGTYRTEHKESNWFHRMFAFCDSTWKGRSLLWLCICSPMILVFGASLVLLDGSYLSALLSATLPWSFCALLALEQLKIERRYRQSR